MKILTIFLILVIIVVCVLVGIFVGKNRIGDFIETTLVIEQSNMTIVIDRPRTTIEISGYYIYPSNNISDQENLRNSLNKTLDDTFSKSFLCVITSTLSWIPSNTYYSNITRYVFNTKAFFKLHYTEHEIKDALEYFHPIITLSNDVRTSSGPGSFNRLLSNVTDTHPTSLTLADLPYITITNGSRAFF